MVAGTQPGPDIMDLSSDTIAMIALQLAVVGFLWSLHRDVRGLDKDLRDVSDRLAKLEGVVETLRDGILGKKQA